MIRIIDFETGIDFDLSENIKISIVKTNPFLSNAGSISLPLNLKWTEKNVKTLNFPHRYDRKLKYVVNRDVVVIYGTDQSRATLVVNSVQKNVSVVCTLLFDESDIYLKMRDISMKQVFSGIVREEYTGTQSEKVAQWIEHFESVLGGITEDDFKVYPVCVKLENIEEDNFIRTSFTLLNEQNVNDATEGPNSYFRFKNRVGGTFTEEGIEVDYPAGYRITGFLKLSYILRRIFEYLDYTLSYDFESDLTLSKITVPNKTNDLLLTGKIRYDQMVPSVSVEKFIEVVRKTYHVEFIAGNDRVIEMVKFDDTLEFDDITALVSSEPVIEPEKFKSLYITCNRNFNVQNSNYTNKIDFNKEFTTPFIDKNTILDLRRSGGGYYFLRSSGVFYHRTSVNFRMKTNTLGNNNFDYYQEFDDREKYDIVCDYESLPMVYIRIPLSVDSLYMPIPFISDEISLNSRIQSESEDKMSLDKSNTECPVMFCFFKGRAAGNSEYNKMASGTTQHYDNSGEIFADYDLVLSGINGLYEKFWKSFNNILQNSFQPIKLNLNLQNMNTFKMHKGKMLNGQPLIPESIKYEISNSGIKVIEAKFRTVKLYK